MLLPSGWLVAELALSDSLLLGGMLLHASSLASQLVSWEVEELCQVKPRLRFPMFRHIMWHAAVHYAKVLLGAAGGSASRSGCCDQVAGRLILDLCTVRKGL